MPHNGPYQFKLAEASRDGVVDDEDGILRGEWAWIDRTDSFVGRWTGKGRPLMIYARCPDCGELCTLWRPRDPEDKRGHSIASDGSVSPSVLHTRREQGVELCGFHSWPTTLLGFVDKR